MNNRKTMCEVPEKVKRVVLYVPSGIKNALSLKSANMMFPMILYWATNNDKWLKKCILPMAVTDDNITDDIYDTAKLSIDYAKIKKAMPSNVSTLTPPFFNILPTVSRKTEKLHFISNHTE